VGFRLRSPERLADNSAVPIEISSRRVGPITVITCTGRITEGVESRTLQEQLNTAITRSPDVVLNLAGINFIDSGGLGLLVRFLTRTQNAHGSLKLCVLPANIAEMLRLTKLNTIFEVHDQEADAISAFYLRRDSVVLPHRFDAEILCVDSSPDSVAYARELLKQAGYAVITAENAPDALTLLRAAQPKLLIIGAGIRATRTTRTTELFNRLADELQVVELPASFSSQDAVEAGQRLLDDVRTRLGR
jgi:anti-sigma B factor antagonist